MHHRREDLGRNHIVEQGGIGLRHASSSVCVGDRKVRGPDPAPQQIARRVLSDRGVDLVLAEHQRPSRTDAVATCTVEAKPRVRAAVDRAAAAYNVVMLPVFADPKTDFVFKRIFGTTEHKSLLIALLNHMLELDDKRRILDVQHLSGDQHVAIPELKLSIVDVKCTDASGRHFVVEMQVLKVEGFEKRVVYNASKAYVMQLRNADEYPVLCDVVGVTICNFNLWNERDPSGTYQVPMLSRWRMQAQHGGTRGLPQVQYAFLELPKYTAGDAPQTLVDRWAYFFREAKNLNVIPPVLSEGPFREALEVARTATFSREEWEAYERAKMAEQDARGALAVARQEGAESGHKSGLAEGHKSGLAEGHKSGLAEGHKSGLAEGKRDALLRLLARVGLVLTQEEQARIATCTDPAMLDRWFDNALGAKTAAHVFS